MTGTSACKGSGSTEARNAHKTTTSSVATKGSSSVKATDLLRADPQFSTFYELLKASGLDGQVDSGEKYTLFVPSNQAFESLGAGRLDDLRNGPKEELRQLLLRQMAPGPLHATDLLLRHGSSVKTLSKEELPIFSVNGELRVGGAKITKSDIEAKNVVIFLVDALADPDASISTQVPGHEQPSQPGA